eukprot:TRINITY_DN16874_c0_g1_i2.p1 TRINITY_DN16874_c0_g1~~TRINITY_DN16874_c0_g1_i2.p1  ORF type:complete len:150 (-),score=67.52 TRINITY_DN16874_c0_g1_i2:82-531(-)
MAEMERRAADKLHDQEETRAAAQGDSDLKRMDTNKDHVVSEQEFLNAGGSKDEFKLYDENRDGVLDGAEMAKRAAAQASAESDTKLMDANRDRMVDEREFLAGGGSKDEFDRYDRNRDCLLYTSDAADEEDSVDLGGRRIIKKKKKDGF